MDYTKGDWKIYPTDHFQDGRESLKIAIGAADQSIALIDRVGIPFFKGGWGEMVANAHLMKAAPKMYEALKEIYPRVVDPGTLNIIREALVEAESKS